MLKAYARILFWPLLVFVLCIVLSYCAHFWRVP